MVNKDNIL